MTSVPVPSLAPAPSGSAIPKTLRQRRGAIAWVVLIVLLIAVVVVSAGIGAVPLSAGQVVAGLVKPIGVSLPYVVSEQQDAVLWAIRLPRIVFGALIGAALATAGAGLQGVFRNPLADPSLIGISSSASLAAASVFVFGGQFVNEEGHLHAMILPVVAFAGALIATYVMLSLARVGRRTAVTTMLLCGIAISALTESGTGALTFIATDHQLRSITFWRLGSLGGATWVVVGATAPFLLATVLVLPRFARTLNLFLLGEAEARHLGVRVDTVKRAIVILAALGVGASVAFAGVIGFVGLVVPHLLRLVLGPDNRYVTAMSPLLGAILVVGADLIARVAVAPAELPIGIVTAAIGAPFFLWLVIRQRSMGAVL